VFHHHSDDRRAAEREPQRLSWVSYSRCTASSKPAAFCWPPTIFCNSGVQPAAKMAPVALAMKSMAPLSCARVAPAASDCSVTEPGSTAGMGRSVGPPGLDPPTSTLILRASSLRATQSRKKAAHSGLAALALMPKVSGEDMEAWRPPSSRLGMMKKPNLSLALVSRLPD